jgi:hypothetical protein
MTSQVTATSLNLRDRPNGQVLAVLPHGARLNVLSVQDGWANVTTVADGQAGFVSAQFIADVPDLPALPTEDLPPPDDDADPVRLVGQAALAPDGRTFAHVFRSGFFTTGVTSLATWLDSLTSSPSTSASRVRVVRAVCANEGNLEAINSYDDSFLSFGLFQWTAGAAAAPGELAALLGRLQAADADAYADCFGRYQLTVDLATPEAVTGGLALGGMALDTPAAKAALRKPEWAYRFWRAGHHPSVRAAQLELAASRIDRFLADQAMNAPVSAWLTSELGIALVLDEHVNRPGHVPGTLVTAIGTLNLPDNTDLTAWQTADEAALIAAYRAARAPTSMTDSEARAQKIAGRVATGELSDERGSFET